MATTATGGFDALVLTGGAGRRLGGVDKATIAIGAHTLLERALAAVAAAEAVVTVGPEHPTAESTTPEAAAFVGGVLEGATVRVTNVREDPPGGGPVAAIEAGLGLVAQPVVVVLACDMPFVTGADVHRLVAALLLADDAVDATMYVAEGQRQPLAAAYRVRSLRRTLRMHGPATGMAMRQLMAPLTVVEIPTDPGVTADCDTWADVDRSRMLLED